MKPLKELMDRYFLLLSQELYSPEYGEGRVEKKEVYNEEISLELSELEKQIRDHPSYQGRVGNSNQ
jgi:hypothetical protein